MQFKTLNGDTVIFEKLKVSHVILKNDRCTLVFDNLEVFDGFITENHKILRQLKMRIK